MSLLYIRCFLLRIWRDHVNGTKVIREHSTGDDSSVPTFASSVFAAESRKDLLGRGPLLLDGPSSNEVRTGADCSLFLAESFSRFIRAASSSGGRPRSTEVCREEPPSRPGTMAPFNSGRERGYQSGIA